MKALVTFFGFLVLLVGLLPFLKTVEFLSFLHFIPSTGLSYQIIIIVIGVLAVLLGLKK